MGHKRSPVLWWLLRFCDDDEWGWQQGQTDDINLGAALDTLGEIRFFSSMFSSSRQNVQCSSMFNVCRTRSPPSTEDCPLNFLKHFYDQSTWKEGLIMDWLWNLFSRRTWKLWPYFQGLGCPGFSLLKVVGTSWRWSQSLLISIMLLTRPEYDQDDVMRMIRSWTMMMRKGNLWRPSPSPTWPGQSWPGEEWGAVPGPAKIIEK